MAVVLSTDTVTVEQSIAGVKLVTTADRNPEDWELLITFEDVTRDSQGHVVRITPGTRFIRKTFGEIMNEPVTVQGVVLTYSEIAAFIKQGCYDIRHRSL